MGDTPIGTGQRDEQHSGSWRWNQIFCSIQPGPSNVWRAATTFQATTDVFPNRSRF